MWLAGIGAGRLGPRPVAKMLRTSAGRAGFGRRLTHRGEKSLACSTSGPELLLRIAGWRERDQSEQEGCASLLPKLFASKDPLLPRQRVPSR